MSRVDEAFHSLLLMAGIELNGAADWDLRVYNPDFYRRVLRNGSLGLGESYMDGWWDSPRLDEFICRVLTASLDEKVKNWRLLPYFLQAVLFNTGRKTKAFEIGQRHYDLGNDLFRKMLDKRMVYSGAYWKDAQTLDEAQEAKLDLICRKLGLQPGMTVLDIGCGWGSFCKYAAEKYEVQSYGITVSREQQALGSELCKGLNVKIILQDYRELNAEAVLGKGVLFNRVVSVGMIEHVGYKNYRRLMKIIHSLLSDDGLFLLQTIGAHKSLVNSDPWTNKYIFPNSMLPSVKQLGASIEGLFLLDDWHSFGDHYDKTLMAWYHNVEESWDELKSGYDERFHRMWKYYLLGAAGGFRARKSQLWQIVMSKQRRTGGYQPVR